MTRQRFAVAVFAVLAGCAGDPSGEQASHVPVDDRSIADEPMPAIKARTFIAAGDLCASKGQYDKAAFQYQQALKASPKDALTARKLALAHTKAGRMPEAVDAWKQYVTASDGSDDAYGSLGYAQELAGKPTEAEATYQAGIAKHSDGPLCRVNYGLMLVRKYDVDNAVKQLSVVLKPAEVNYNIASVYSDLGRKDLAQFYYKRALQCDPGFVPARQKLAMID